MTRVITCFGEALIDFLQDGERRTDGLTLPVMVQYPGGAPANVAVAVAKLGGQSRFVGQVGSDGFGAFLTDALRRYGVDVGHVLKHATAPTAMAFVSRDDNGDRSFSFYRDRTADMVLSADQLCRSQFAPGGLLHFCSNTLTERAGEDATARTIDLAGEQECEISFDVNLRHNLWSSRSANRGIVNAFAERAQILKFSSEELEYLAGGNEPKYIANLLAGAARLVIVTNGAARIQCHSRSGMISVEPPPVIAVDTTGAGDGFIGGLLMAFGRYESLGDVLREPGHLDACLAFAVACGAVTASRPGAYPSLPVFSDVSDYWGAAK